MTKLLLVGGCEKDERKLAPKLKDYNLSIGWHWMNSNALATRGVFPSCDGVLVFTRACSHSLTKGVSDLARKAGVPVVPFDSWPRLEPALKNAGLAPTMSTVTPRTEMVTISVSTAALQLPTKDTHVAPTPQAAPAAVHALPPVGGRLKAYPQDDEVILAVHTDWENLSQRSKTAVQDFLASYSLNRTTLMPVPVRGALSKYTGNARGFVAFAVLATKDANVTVATLGFLYIAVTGKNLHHGMTLKMGTKVQDFCGLGHGLKPGRPVASGVPIPAPVTPPPQPTPVVVATPPRKGIRPPTASDDVLLAVHGYWDLLPKEQAAGVTHYLTSLDVDGDAVLGDTVREHLSKYDGQPRAFVALCMLATKEQHIRHTTLKNAHQAVLGKGLSTDAIPKMEAKVLDICGDGYGLRRGGTAPIVAKPVVTPSEMAGILGDVQNAPPVITTLIAEAPVTPTPAKIELVKPTPPVLQEVTRHRFERYVWAALDAGEKVTISREGAAYVVSHDDGTDMVFRPRE